MGGSKARGTALVPAQHRQLWEPGVCKGQGKRRTLIAKVSVPADRRISRRPVGSRACLLRHTHPGGRCDGLPARLSSVALAPPAVPVLAHHLRARGDGAAVAGVPAGCPLLAPRPQLPACAGDTTELIQTHLPARAEGCAWPWPVLRRVRDVQP